MIKSTDSDTFPHSVDVTNDLTSAFVLYYWCKRTYREGEWYYHGAREFWFRMLDDAVLMELTWT